MALEHTENKVTSLEQLKEYGKGRVIELPSFSKDEPFFVRVKRPSLMKLAEEGKIPNMLLGTVNKMFFNGVKEQEVATTDGMFAEMSEVMRILAKSMLVEPTYEEIEEAGVTLTDSQLIAIFNYSQAGIEAVTPSDEES